MKDKTTVILVAAGEGVRWNNYLGTTKHKVIVDGESLLERTVRLFKGCDIKIIGRDETYEVEGAELCIPKEVGMHDLNRQCYNSQHLWNQEGRTIIVLGDVFFTKEAVKTIRGYKGDDIRIFGRKAEGIVNGCKWGELFAHTFLPEHHTEYANAYLRASKIIKDDGRLNDWWEHYRYLDGINPMVHDTGKRFVEINDFTDDFDRPENYKIWKKFYDNKPNE